MKVRSAVSPTLDDGDEWWRCPVCKKEFVGDGAYFVQHVREHGAEVAEIVFIVEQR